MNKNPNPSALAGQKVPYFIRVRDGNKFLTKTGKWVAKTPHNAEDIHIPQSMFEKLLPYMDMK